jgi:hypothetical protein
LNARMSITASPWYTSGTLWAAVAAVAAVLAVIAAVVVPFMVTFPKRRLMYGMPLSAPMLVAPQGVRGELELRHRGVPLQKTHVVELKLVNRGRRDIPSSDFDNGTPITLDTSARIIELLQTTSEPSTIPAPAVVVDGSALKIGPGLIGRGQRITYTVLVDGEPELKYQGTLQDVQVRQLSDDERASDASNRLVGSVVLLALAVAYTAFRASDPASATPAEPPVLLALLAAITGTVSADLARRLGGRR